MYAYVAATSIVVMSSKFLISIFVLIAITLMGVANGDHTITCPCFGYSVDGGACASSGSAFSIVAGTSETITVDSGCAAGDHPVVITTAAGAVNSVYSGASGSAGGVTGTSFTLTVPSSTSSSTMYVSSRLPSPLLAFFCSSYCDMIMM
jgi:hypothetical protein